MATAASRCRRRLSTRLWAGRLAVAEGGLRTGGREEDEEGRVAEAQVAAAGAEKERGGSEQPGGGASRHSRRSGLTDGWFSVSTFDHLLALDCYRLPESFSAEKNHYFSKKNNVTFD